VPEGDSVFKVARRMREQLVGRTVVRSGRRIAALGSRTKRMSGRPGYARRA